MVVLRGPEDKTVDVQEGAEGELIVVVPKALKIKQSSCKKALNINQLSCKKALKLKQLWCQKTLKVNLSCSNFIKHNSKPLVKIVSKLYFYNTF